jgi:hypothetical protein
MFIKEKAYFNYVLFEDGKKILFGIEDLSRVSFMNTDITRVRFSDRAKWGEQDKFKVFEEETLEKEFLERKTPNTVSLGSVMVLLEERNPTRVSLGNVMAVYRNLRENYEFKLRYDEAGEFFKKEMELKRKYREVVTPLPEIGTIAVIKENNWFRKTLSLTGLYYHFSRYGESILRPTIIGIMIVVLSTVFWLFQNNPSAELYIPFITSNKPHIAKTFSNFINGTQILNNTHNLKAFERSLGDFLPTLSLASDIKISIIDYIVKIVGGGLTFVLLAVALRRKFERKYTR